MDTDGNGTIELDEYLAAMARPVSLNHGEGLEELKETFRMFDRDGSGQISKEELEAIMKQLGKNLTDEELEQMIKEVDTDGDGHVDFEEFRKVRG
ncbi:calmodulin-like protein [Cantharellus anzutake]|uniref:calmodulin-like protein n=1 Tax=Cantharellus anzutake TaxID=1750568 RepID=UPI0019038208|nr:calmodulin-like protein [Cantharellus anzutake]KAF8336360.1 calmodulin-like protein [Cantharellus anzutake]